MGSRRDDPVRWRPEEGDEHTPGGRVPRQEGRPRRVFESTENIRPSEIQEMLTTALKGQLHRRAVEARRDHRQARPVGRGHRPGDTQGGLRPPGRGGRQDQARRPGRRGRVQDGIRRERQDPARGAPSALRGRGQEDQVTCHSQSGPQGLYTVSQFEAQEDRPWLDSQRLRRGTSLRRSA